MPGKHKNRKSFRDPDRPIGARLSDRERTQILTLWGMARWNKSQIARKLGLARSTVITCIQQGFTTPPPAPDGRRPNLTTQKRKRLVWRATLDAFHRRLTYESIAFIEGIQACKRSLKAAFEKEQLNRRVATAKPPLTAAHMQARLQWAILHRNWTDELWDRVIWTDEASFAAGGFGKVYVTRSVDEKYHHSCLTPKFRGYSSWMIHGCISGLAKGPLTFFEKDWGKINSQVYCQKVLPSIKQFARYLDQDLGFMGSILMCDGASTHTSKLTKSYFVYYGFNKMDWPANSPDLNPIENVWRLIKYRVSRRFPLTEGDVRRYVQEEWDKLTVGDFIKYIREMPERVEAVIKANGGHTKW